MHQPDPDLEPALALYETYASTVLTYLLRKVGSREEAEDILLDVFIAILEKGSDLRQEAHSQRALLFAIARNKVIDHYRRVQRVPSVSLVSVQNGIYAYEEHEPEQATLQLEERERLYAHVRELPAIQQEILQLRFGENLPCAEIGHVMARSEGAVRALLYRALKALRRRYGTKRAERNT